MQKRQVSGPVSKRDCLLDPNQISELIMDSDNDEPLSDVAGMKDEEYRVFHNVLRVYKHL